MDIREYMTTLAKEAGVADDELQAALKVIGNEKVSKALNEATMMRSDYSRNQDALAAEKKRLTDWYNTELKRAQDNEKVVNEYANAVKKYEEAYGPLDGGTGSKSSVDTSQFIDKKTFEEALGKQGQQFITVTKIATKCSADYMKRFGEVLDMDALEKFTLESGLPLAAAYDKFIEPRNREIENKSIEEKLKKAREEGMQEGLSKRDNPTNPGNPSPNGFMANLNATSKVPSARDGFVEAFLGQSK